MFLSPNPPFFSLNSSLRRHHAHTPLHPQSKLILPIKPLVSFAPNDTPIKSHFSLDPSHQMTVSA